MTCVEPDHFHEDDGAIGPQPWMQYRQVATVSAASKAGSYPVAGGGPKNDLLQTAKVSWVNNTPVSQYVYGLVTRAGAAMALQGRSRAHLVAYHGLSMAAGDPPLVEVSRFGVGLDVGAGGTFGNNAAFGVAEQRQNSHTMPLMPSVTGWTLLTPGQMFTGMVSLRFISEFWETQAVAGGEEGSESSYISGDTRLDLFAVPVV
ncbi:hypothetical protein SEA_EVAA_31 [Gordonia phage Evaa]|nr:hypothetical protein SEA_EVAA_31 [Gordonia phage Evaa]